MGAFAIQNESTALTSSAGLTPLTLLLMGDV